jgi:MFS family permease
MTAASASAISRSRLYWGWYVVAALFIGGFALYGAGLYSFILFVTPLSNEFHWSHAATGTLVSAFWISAPIALLAEPLIRRFGVARLAIAGILIEAVCLMLLFTASQLWQMYLLRTLAGFGKVLYAINLPIILANWFTRRFGMALAVMYCGWHLGGMALAPLTAHLIGMFGWRIASAALGVGLLLIALPPTLWVLKVPSARSMGLALDGDAAGAAAGGTPAAPEEPRAAATVGEVLGLRSFRLIAAASVVYYLTYSGVLAHQAASIDAAGGPKSFSSMVVGSTAGCAALGALLIGWIIDHWPLLRATLVQYSLMAAGVACLLLATQHMSLPLLFGHALLFGLAVGGTDIFWITMVRRRTPERLFTRAWSIWYFIELAVIVVAPFFAGRIYDLSGSYSRALLLELVIIAVPVVLCARVARMPAEPA